MPEPLAPQGSWTDLILPFAVGAGALGAGFAAGRNPGAENPGDAFLKAMQIPSLIDQREANAAQNRAMLQYYQGQTAYHGQQAAQAGYNTAVQAVKPAIEMGDVDSIMAAKDQLGPYFQPMFQAAVGRRNLLVQRGWAQPWQGGQAQPGQPAPQGGLPQTPALGPGSPAMPSQVAPAPAQGQTGYRPDVTETFSIGPLSETRRTPGTTEPQLVTEFLGRYQSVPSPIQLQQDLARENAARQARGTPTIPWTKDAQEVYMARLQWERPDLYERVKTFEESLKVPPEIAARRRTMQAQPGTNPLLDPFTQQRSVEVQQAEEMAAAGQRGHRKEAIATEKMRDEARTNDDYYANLAGIMSLRPYIERKYGNYPSGVQGLINDASKGLGSRDPMLATYAALLGRVFNLDKKKFAGTATNFTERADITQYIPDASVNVREAYRQIDILYRNLDRELQRDFGTIRQIFPQEPITQYQYFQIQQRLKQGLPPIDLPLPKRGQSRGQGSGQPPETHIKVN